MHIHFGKTTLTVLGRTTSQTPAKVLKEGCLLIIKGIKASIKKVRLTGITLNFGFIGLNFAGGSSKVNMQRIKYGLF